MSLSADVDPIVIDAWRKTCQSHERLRRVLRITHRVAGLCFIAICFAAIGSDTVKNSGWLLHAIGVSLVLLVLAAIWNNILVGRPRCPKCNEVVTGWFGPHGFTISHPEAEQSCAFCHAWLMQPK